MKMKSIEKLVYSFLVLAVLCLLMAPGVDGSVTLDDNSTSTEINGLVPSVAAAVAPVAFFTQYCDKWNGSINCPVLRYFSKYPHQAGLGRSVTGT